MDKTTSYTVLVDDNYDFYDEDERYCAGVYNSLDDALEKCLRIVGEYILEQDYPAMKAADLYESYTFCGDDPFIQGLVPVKFSAWDYAKALANVLAGTPAEDGPQTERRFRLSYLGALMLEAKDKEAGK